MDSHVKYMSSDHKNCVIFSVMRLTHSGPFGVTYDSKKCSSFYYNFEVAKLGHWPGMSQKLQGVPFWGTIVSTHDKQTCAI